MPNKTKSSGPALDFENHKDLLDTLESIQPPSSKSKVFPAAFKCFLNLFKQNFKFSLAHKTHCKADARTAQGGLV